MFKNITIFVVYVLSLELAFANRNGESHVINDCLDPGDHPVVIFDQDVTKAARFLQTQKETLRLPSTGSANGDISCLTVTNLDSAEEGGYPKITEGGVGYKYVILELKSQLSKGFNFRVTAYYAE